MILHGFHELHDAPVIRKSLSDIFNVMKHGLLDKISPQKSAMIFQPCLMTLEGMDGLAMNNGDFLWLVGGLEHEFHFPFHICDVIPTPLTNSIIFQRGRSTTNQIIINHH